MSVEGVGERFGWSSEASGGEAEGGVDDESVGERVKEEEEEEEEEAVVVVVVEERRLCKKRALPPSSAGPALLLLPLQGWREVCVSVRGTACVSVESTSFHEKRGAAGRRDGGECVWGV